MRSERPFHIAAPGEQAIKPEHPIMAPPDLSVGDEMAELILRRRWRAVVRVSSDDVTVHPGLCRMMRSQLRGRESSIALLDEHVEINFGVFSGDYPSFYEAYRVGDYLSAVLDPVQRRNPTIELRCTDTTDIDPYLPEHKRTLR